jgi:methylthioribose-1-phosphate isomerase
MNGMTEENYFAIDFREGKFLFLDQTLLPNEEIIVETESYNRIAEAIERLEIRGAPAIGVAAAYGLTLAMKDVESNRRDEEFEKAYKRLVITRPTAVNLFFALDEIKKVFMVHRVNENLYHQLLKRAIEIHKDDQDKCEKIGEYGSRLFHKKMTVLTHCNTGKLATSGNGTAFNVIRHAFQRGYVGKVFADETRPLLQGSRLTAFELEKNKIPFEIISDSSAAYLMQKNLVDIVIVGADRIALNGDTANKIGTYSLAVASNFHNIPFYIAAPTTTIDKNILTGGEIDIEIRNKLELLGLFGKNILPQNYGAYTPAFDVTPSHLISGIITEKGIYNFPYNFLNE